MTISEARYVVVDCYPLSGTKDFAKYAGAAVGCWIRQDLCIDSASADAIVADKLLAIGWRVARTLVREDVSVQTYANKSDGRELFYQALIDGFVANLHVVARESIGESPLSEEQQLDALSAVAGTIGRQGGVFMYSNIHQQWANGVTPAGNDYVPLWSSQEDASEWQSFWPGYELQDLTADELRASDLLECLNAEDMWIGLGIGQSLLTMCHPIWLSAISLQLTHRDILHRPGKPS